MRSARQNLTEGVGITQRLVRAAERDRAGRRWQKTRFELDHGGDVRVRFKRCLQPAFRLVAPRTDELEQQPIASALVVVGIQTEQLPKPLDPCGHADDAALPGAGVAARKPPVSAQADG